MDKETELSVINDIRQGNDRFTELMERYHTGLIIHCDRLVQDRDEAEEIAQEAFVRSYLHLDTFDPDKSRYVTWLYNIATNLAIDHFRKKSRYAVLLEIDQIAEPVHADTLTGAERQEIRDRVTALMPPEYREVIEQYYWHGKSYQEIANAMHVPINTVRTWLRRAKVQLQKELA